MSVTHYETAEHFLTSLYLYCFMYKMRMIITRAVRMSKWGNTQKVLITVLNQLMTISSSSSSCRITVLMKYILHGMLFRFPDSLDFIPKLFPGCLSFLSFPFFSITGDWTPSLLGARQLLYPWNYRLPLYIFMLLNTIADDSLIEQYTGIPNSLKTILIPHNQKEWLILNHVRFVKLTKGRFLSSLISWLMSNESYFRFCNTSLYFSSFFLFSLAILS